MKSFLLMMLCMLSAFTVDAYQSDPKKAVWVDMDGVSVPLPPVEHPRLFVRSDEIPALRLKMQHPSGQKILKKLAKANMHTLC